MASKWLPNTITGALCVPSSVCWVSLSLDFALLLVVMVVNRPSATCEGEDRASGEIPSGTLLAYWSSLATLKKRGTLQLS